MGYSAWRTPDSGYAIRCCGLGKCWDGSTGWPAGAFLAEYDPEANRLRVEVGVDSGSAITSIGSSAGQCWRSVRSTRASHGSATDLRPGPHSLHSAAPPPARLRHSHPDTLHRRFLNTGGIIETHGRQITVRLNLRTYSPILRQATLPETITVPWWEDRTLRYEYA